MMDFSNEEMELIKHAIDSYIGEYSGVVAEERIKKYKDVLNKVEKYGKSKYNLIKAVELDKGLGITRMKWGGNFYYKQK